MLLLLLDSACFLCLDVPVLILHQYLQVYKRVDIPPRNEEYQLWGQFENEPSGVSDNVHYMNVSPEVHVVRIYLACSLQKFCTVALQGVRSQMFSKRTS